MRVEFFRDGNGGWCVSYTTDAGTTVEGKGETERDALLNGMIVAADRVEELQKRLDDPMTYADLTERD